MIVSKTKVSRAVTDPVFTGENILANQQEFSMDVDGVGSFYVSGGNEVEFTPLSGADPGWVELILNGQVLVALLHQRRIINFHASSFIHNSRGIMILGGTGAGKSSVTASFILNGAGFLSDDLTPVIFRGTKPYIWPLYRAIKLRENTVGQLNISHMKLRDAETGTEKQYLAVAHAGVEDYPLHTVLKIEIGGVSKPEFHKTAPAERFSLLRSEICSWEILAGMPDTEAEYLQQLLKIVRKVKIIRVVRPAEIEISALHTAISDYLATER